MSLEFKKISGSTPYLLNSASTAEELTLALEDYMRTGAQIIFTHDGEDCILSSFEYKSGIESTVIAYFVTPKKKLLKVDTAAGYDLVITESGDFAEKKDITWENLTDKPFGEITENLGDTITWDGNLDTFKGVKTEPHSDVDEMGNAYTIQYVKVSESTPNIDDIGDNSTLTYIVSGEETTNKATAVQLDEEIILLNIYFNNLAVIVLTDNSEALGLIFPEKGIYFAHLSSPDDSSVAGYCTKFTIPNYNFVNTTLKKIDEKYLHESVIKSDSAEIWFVDATGDEIQRNNLVEMTESQGGILNIDVVDILPETLKQSNMQTDEIYVYVVKSTGIGYWDAGNGVTTVGDILIGDGTLFDKGWSDDVNAETETGIYCVRTEKNVPTKDYVDSAVANAVANAIGDAIGGSY